MSLEEANIYSYSAEECNKIKKPLHCRETTYQEELIATVACTLHRSNISRLSNCYSYRNCVEDCHIKRK
jgi:hypothetical protein